MGEKKPDVTEMKKTKTKLEKDRMQMHNTQPKRNQLKNWTTKNLSVNANFSAEAINIQISDAQSQRCLCIQTYE